MDEPTVKAALPERLEVEADGLRIGLVHDPGPAVSRHGRLASAFPGCDVIAYGHTHLPEMTREGERWIVNPGSPTERRGAPGHTMVVIESGRPTLVSLDA
jgi:predicted phosphodiesterase